MKDVEKREFMATATIPDLVMMNALDLSKAIQSKQVSCKQVMATYLDHIERTNIKVNAIVSLQNPEELLRQAAERDQQLARGEYLGWMHGLPHAVKDAAPTKGIRTTWGSPLLDTVPQADAIFVRAAEEEWRDHHRQDQHPGIRHGFANL